MLVLSIFAILFIFKADFNQRVHQTYDQMFVSKNEKTEMVFFSETHHSHYQIAYKMFKENLIWSWGKIFRHYCEKMKIM